jgi:hypothetical protein
VSPGEHLIAARWFLSVSPPMTFRIDDGLVGIVAGFRGPHVSRVFGLRRSMSYVQFTLEDSTTDSQ